MKPPSSDINVVVELLKENFTSDIIAENSDCSPLRITVTADSLVKICKFLHSNDKCYFDHLSSISGMDNGPDAGTLEVIYNLHSLPLNQSLMLQVVLPREKPSVASLAKIWMAANWHERETYDLFGIVFEGHPDLRRILLPDDWEGHPLRKDYQQQQYYRGIKVEYDQQDPV